MILRDYDIFGVRNYLGDFDTLRTKNNLCHLVCHPCLYRDNWTVNEPRIFLANNKFERMIRITCISKYCIFSNRYYVSNNIHTYELISSLRPIHLVKDLKLSY